MEKTVFIAGGGTGGHIYPGISLARELKKRGFNPIFILNRKDYSIPVVKNENLDFRQINMIKMERRLSLKNLFFILAFFISFFKAVKLIIDLKPCVVIGFGGYVSFPVIFAGKISGLKILIHEQNYLPGLANRILGKIADRIAITFPETERYFKKEKIVLSGNPVRKEILMMDKNKAYEKLNLDSKRFTVFVFGGSQGAHSLNMLVSESLVSFEKKGIFQVIHITGKNDLSYIKEKYNQAGIKASVFAYLYDIGYAYSVADIVVCRAGATTVTELEYLEKPAILIPFPFATDDHQKYNAWYYEKTGFGIVIEEKEFDKEKFLKIIKDLIEGKMKFKRKIEKIKKESSPEEILSLTVEELSKR